MGIAHGYYFASGRAQAVILHTNVGLANGAIGAINIATDHVPVILMSGRTPTTERGRFGARTVPIGWGQEMRDQAALVREACKWDYEVRFPEQVPELLDRAYAIATSTPEGPGLSQPAARGAVRAVPGRSARRPPIAMRAASVVAAPDQLADAAAAARRRRAAADRRPARRRLAGRVRRRSPASPSSGRSRCASTGRTPPRSPPSTRCTSARTRRRGSPRPT